MVLAALMNALRVVEKRAAEVKVVVVGAGAAGVACTEIMLAHGVRNIIVCDIEGALYAGRPGLDPVRMALAARTNPTGNGAWPMTCWRARTCSSACRGRALCPKQPCAGWQRGRWSSRWPTRSPRCVSRRSATTSRSWPPVVRITPNQINNVLAFPGVFRGALDVRARTINEEMKLAAAQAIAGVVADDELHAEYIIPSVFNREVVKAVALAVARAAEASGVARRPPPARPTRPELAQLVDDCLDPVGDVRCLIKHCLGTASRPSPNVRRTPVVRTIFPTNELVTTRLYFRYFLRRDGSAGPLVAGAAPDRRSA